ncbi:MAG: type II CAAX endopeptidase family protein [Muricomes sp.]
MYNNYKQIKFWQGLLVLASAALILFVVAPAFLAPFGMYGSLIGEWLMLAVALGLILIFGNRPGAVFPLKKPTGLGTFGTVLMWVGAFLIEMTLVLVLSIFFPEDILSVNGELTAGIVNIPLLAAILIVAVTPAICEEAVFRGIFLKSLKPQKHKWAAVLICGVVFGIFHGDIFRFVPTAIGGIVMAYILLESDNMFYNCFFHFINNLLPILLLFGMKDIYKDIELLSGTGYQETAVMSAGMYMMMCTAAPACLYIGNYLLHSRTIGYRDKLFPSGKPGTVIALVVVSALLFFAGLILMVCGLVKSAIPFM